MKTATKIALFIVYNAVIIWLSDNGWIWWAVGVPAALLVLWLIWRIWIKHRRRIRQEDDLDYIMDMLEEKKDKE